MPFRSQSPYRVGSRPDGPLISFTFFSALEKLEKLVDKLGLDLGKYNKDLAGFLKKREQNLIKSEEKIIRIRLLP